VALNSLVADAFYLPAVLRLPAAPIAVANFSTVNFSTVALARATLSSAVRGRAEPTGSCGGLAREVVPG